VASRLRRETRLCLEAITGMRGSLLTEDVPARTNARPISAAGQLLVIQALDGEIESEPVISAIRNTTARLRALIDRLRESEARQCCAANDAARPQCSTRRTRIETPSSTGALVIASIAMRPSEGRPTAVASSRKIAR
jgi:hypothetical protein